MKLELIKDENLLKTKRYSEHSTFVSSVRVLKRERFHNANLRGSRIFYISFRPNYWRKLAGKVRLKLQKRTETIKTHIGWGAESFTSRLPVHVKSIHLDLTVYVSPLRV